MKQIFQQIFQFFKEVRVELSKVEWPKRKEFIGATIVTLLLVFFFTVYLGLIDKANRLVIYDVFIKANK